MAKRPAAKDFEELPEADRLDVFPHPRRTDKLFGHEAAEAKAREAFASERVHHAWLIGGPKGIGKATFAYRVAAWALASTDERQTAASRLAIAPDSRTMGQIRALSHPGLLVIRRPYDTKAKRFTASIPVDEVRRLRSFLSHKSEAGDWRVIIVDSADEMNVNAANALLKSLEEPPPNALFLLLSSEPGRLLPTIRSRCHRLDLAPLASDPLRRAALQALAAADDEEGGTGEDTGLAQLEPFAGGSVGALLMLQAGGGDKLYEQARGLLLNLPKVDWPKVHALGDELASVAATQRFETFFQLLFDCLHRAIRAGTGLDSAAPDRQLSRRLFALGEGASAPAARLASWAELWETMQREKAETLGLNLDRKALILDCVARMETLARRQAR